MNGVSLFYKRPQNNSCFDVNISLFRCEFFLFSALPSCNLVSVYFFNANFSCIHSFLLMKSQVHNTREKKGGPNESTLSLEEVLCQKGPFFRIHIVRPLGSVVML